MRLSIMFLLALSSCGKRVEAQPPQTVLEEINTEIARIEPQLVLCEGAPGKLPCSNTERQSDSWGLLAYYSIGKYVAAYDTFVINSIREDGKPFRSPAHMRENIDSFSRDHIISLSQWSLASGNVEPLRKVIAYASRNNWYVCGENRCLLTPGLLNVLGDVASHFGARRPFGTNVPDYIAESQITIDANSGQDCSLVLDTVWLKANTGNLTTTFVNAAKKCNETHQSLYSRYIVALTATGDYASLQEDTLAELKAWQPMLEGGHFTRSGSGFALTALGRLVQK
jgi:hypothetical protein